MTGNITQTVSSIGYLGPPGTFCGEAIASQPDLVNLEQVSFRAIQEVIDAVENGTVDRGLVPVENSIEGVVTAALDGLARTSELWIQREVDLPVSLHLCVVPGATIAGLERIASHPSPLEQCRGWLAENAPDARLIPVSSTIEGARLVAEARDPAFGAIGAELGAKLHGLEIAAAEIEDQPGNETRFVLLGSEIPGPTWHDKTSIVCFQHEDAPGSLVAILNEFAERGINLTKIDSRPSKQGLGQYCFFLDFLGHICEDRVSVCLERLAAAHADVKFLGSYPVRAVPGAAARGTARTRPIARPRQVHPGWIASLRARVTPPAG